MATNFDVIHLGNFAALDPTEGNTQAENAAALIGTTLGSPGDPLFDHIQSFSAISYTGGTNNAYDSDNFVSTDVFSIDGGGTQNFDTLVGYGATLTYADGTTANVTALIMQDDAGELYLMPQLSFNADQAAMESKPIEAITVNSVVLDATNMAAERYDGSFAGPVEGTAGDDSMGVGYTDADGHQISNNADIINSGGGNDTISAGGGDDTIIIEDAGNYTIDGGAGRDVLDVTGLTTGGYSVTFTSIEEIRDNDDPNSWSWDSGDVLAYGNGGDDTLVGGAGNDTVFGGDGADIINTGDGADSVEAGAGDDTIIGGAGADYVWGGEGLDIINYNGSGAAVNVDLENYSASGGDAAGDSLDGVDGLIGSDFNDTLIGSSFTGYDANGEYYTTVIYGQGGDDSIDGRGGDDSLYGGTGNDTILGGDGADVIEGNEGNDSIFYGTGADTVYGGDGADYIDDAGGYDSSSEGSTVYGEAGNDTLNGTAGGDFIDGGADNDVIAGESGNDTIYGGDGSDYIDAGDGDDYIDSGDGSFNNDDTVFGGAGNDTILGSSTVFDSDDYFDGGTGDDLILGSGGADTIIGGDGNDSLYGGTDWDTISGGAGDDLISGGTYVDSLYGDAGNDTIYTGTHDDYADGGDDADTFIMEDDWDDDTIVGGEGGVDNDTLDLSQLSDDVTVTFYTDDSGFVTDGVNTILFSQIENVIFTDQNDVIDASATSGGMTLDGGDGDDSIISGAGDDLLTGGTGDDTISYAVGDGHDTITDWGNETGTIHDGDNTNNDFVDLSSFYDNLQELYADQADDGILNQSNTVDGKGRAVDYSDNDQFGAGSLKINGAGADSTGFTEENTGVVCFVAGTQIETPRGPRPVERLRAGDWITTRDNGPQPLLWMGEQSVSAAALKAQPRLAPVLIREGILGAERDLLVSPQHCLLYGQDHLIRARHLIDLPHSQSRVARGKRGVVYYHLLFESHQIIFANGVASESFYPGPFALRALIPWSKTTLLDIAPAFGRIRTKAATRQVYGATARPVLSRADLRALAPLPLLTGAFA